jgi:hypothetical protein
MFCRATSRNFFHYHLQILRLEVKQLGVIPLVVLQSHPLQLVILRLEVKQLGVIPIVVQCRKHIMGKT